MAQLPSELESQVTTKVEDAVSSVEGIRHIMSSVSDGISATTIMFSLDANTDRALAAVKDAVGRIRGDLPKSASEPLIHRVDAVGLGILTYAAISPGKSPEQLSHFVDDVVIRKLKDVAGVSSVERIGGAEREVEIALNPDRLRPLGLTAAEVSQRLQATQADHAANAPGGERRCAFRPARARSPNSPRP